ncbi:large ribosomal subunit protein mL42 [Antennarius striatus]|uniref:large ribosomal subunit protein mL42 n=1 Tax=Antennarius striatus TaxID=241820 RepID=UPI0035B35496
MASGRFCQLHRLVSRLFIGPTLRHPQKCLVPVQLKSTVSGPPPEGDVEVAVTSDGKTVVCHHPIVDIPYELTQPIKRPDPLTNAPDTHDQVLKAHLSKETLKYKMAPTIEELSKMFFTTKHRWYPVGQYRTRRRKKNPPKDR